MRMHLFLLAPLVMLGLGDQDTQAEDRSPGKDYVPQIQAARKAKDARFRDEKSSPLGVVALIKLDNPRITIGSSPDADLTLSGRSVEPIHAVVVREDLGNKTVRWLLKPVGGKIINEQTREPVESAELRKGDRYLVGKHAVYLDQLGSLGEVLRAFDPRAEAFTQFKGLGYFPVDARFRVEAEVLPDSAPRRVTVIDTNGWSRPAWKYGQLRFRLEGQDLALHLWIFKPDPGPQDEFFIAFRDETNGDESYGGGRYVDIPFVKSGRTFLDFNLAYNPSCAYNTGFACPIPPPENRLPVAVKAGEKALKDH
ncbi:MAG: DUF1684 domain-containing protein [Acidobacteria bacterium]|nr:MAG: DUF1684 domain-containing protein [Acidobacteriota bacterium]RPJ64656.1 MAG: DUF1684 domain-containing protein [Acidobacteriota bacterium]